MQGQDVSLSLVRAAGDLLLFLIIEAKVFTDN